MAEFEFYARCASGCEPVLAQELKELHIKSIRPLKGGVAFFGGLEAGYRACLWSRSASRILLVLARVDASDAQALYLGASSIDWAGQVSPEGSIAVYAHGTNNELRNTQFTAVKVKDALCDRLRAACGVRPRVEQRRPDVQVDVAIRDNKARIAIDLSGEPLHIRGYRQQGRQSAAPLKENLAASIVLACGWKDIAAHGGTFLDPMCGSGTLAIEAAWIAADRAPGLLREYWGFSAWLGHDRGMWEGLVEEADRRFESAVQSLPRISASDADEGAVALAVENAKRAGIGSAIDFAVRDASDMGGALEGASAPGLMLANPPYGLRLADVGLEDVYRALSKGMDGLPENWHAAVFTPDEAVDTALGRQAQSVERFYNGSIETQLRHYSLGQAPRQALKLESYPGGKPVLVNVAELNSRHFADRLRKMAKQRRKWAQREDISCYRIYDADLPEYRAAIEVFEGCWQEGSGTFLTIAEYQAPVEVDPDRALRRFNDMVAIAPALLEVPSDHVFTKRRVHDRGGSQYRDGQRRSFTISVTEDGYTFELDLDGHLDTGIFLDHRITRGLVGSMAQGARFLNLFAYTGTASVHAAGGGAAETTTVDLSQNYLSWARRNMEANGFSGGNHRYARADAMSWLKRKSLEGTFDLVFVDPPTFSNSKIMGKSTFSVQRDHVELLRRVHAVLAKGGRAVFSCNLRNFKPETEKLARLGIELDDISASTIPEDFVRNPKIHKCYLFEKNG